MIAHLFAEEDMHFHVVPARGRKRSRVPSRRGTGYGYLPETGDYYVIGRYQGRAFSSRSQSAGGPVRAAAARPNSPLRGFSGTYETIWEVRHPHGCMSLILKL